MPKRCLVITYYFPPVGGGGVQRMVKFIKYLTRWGWEFTVITSDPSSAFNIPRDKSLINELPENIEIVRIPNPLSSPQKSMRNKVISLFKSNYFSRWVTSFFFLPDVHRKWALKARKTAETKLAESNYNVVLVSAPPYSLAMEAAYLTENSKIPVVLDMRDPWTTNPFKIYPTKIHSYLDKKIEMAAIGKVKFGVSVVQNLLNFYSSEISNFSKKKWIYIPNGFDEEDFFTMQKQTIDNGQFNLAFSGTIYSHLNNPHLLFKAMVELKAEFINKIIFHHIGKSIIPLKKIATEYNLQDYLKEWGYKSHGECLNILSGMDAFLLFWDNSDKKSGNTLGAKIYEYLRLQKPILALISENGEAADFIKETHSGVIIDPHDTNGIREILEDWILKKPVINSQNIEKYERKELAAQLELFLSEISAI